MKRKPSRLILVLVLVLLIVLLIAGYFYLQPGGGALGGGAPPTPTPIEKVLVVMSRRLVPKDTYLDATNLAEYFETREITKTRDLPADYAESLYELEGKVTRVDLPKESIARRSLFVEATLSFRIAPDKRAMPVEVDRFSGVVGQIVRDDHVDVILSGVVEEYFMQKFPLQEKCELPGSCPTIYSWDFPSTNIEPLRLLAVKVMMEDIRVLDLITLTVEVAPAAGRPSGTPTPVPVGIPTSWIAILEVDEQQAEILRFARDQGWNTVLILRPRGDVGRQPTAGVTTWSLLDPQSAYPYRMPYPRAIPHPVAPAGLPSGVIPWIAP